jgi:hypothetical protein
MSKETLRQGDRGGAVRELQTMLNAVGANLNVDGDFGEVTDDCVRDFQAYAGITEDGVCGPVTWQRLEMALARRQHMDTVARKEGLEAAGEDAVKRALAMWQTDIYDPRKDDKSELADMSKAAIDAFIRGPKALNWTWEQPYAGDGAFQWCGAFAAYCWPGVKQSLRQLYFSSTLRLDRYASYQSYNGGTNTGKGRLYVKLDENSTVDDVKDIWRPGDILIIGPERPKTPHVPASWHDYGNHICIVEAFDEKHGEFWTVEGNGNGVGPHGEKQQGVVKAKRQLGGPGWHARRLIRPSEEDLA